MGMKTPCMTYSESGQPTGGGPCAEFKALKSERDHLAGVVQGMEEQGERNAKELHWHNQRLVDVMKERDALRDALKSVEWSGRYDAFGRAGCPKCRRLKIFGEHTPSCIVGNALKETDHG